MSGQPSPSTSAAARPFWMLSSALAQTGEDPSVPPSFLHRYMGRYGSGDMPWLVVTMSGSPSLSISTTTALVGQPRRGGTPSHPATVDGPSGPPK
jgi:hypothetical protein